MLDGFLIQLQIYNQGYVMDFQIEYLAFLFPLSLMIGGAVWVHLDSKKIKGN